MLKCNSSLQSHVLRGLFMKGNRRGHTVIRKVNVNSFSLKHLLPKDIINKLKRQTTDLEKLCAVHKTDKR